MSLAGEEMLKFSYHFSKQEIDPFDEIIWEKRVASIKEDGRTIFKQDVEVPSTWSQNATDIVAQHYLKVVDGIKENSVKQNISRVSKTIAKAGVKGGYFDKANSEVFEKELRWLLVNQYFCFNSPVWYNVGIQKFPQSSACFIQSVEDNMESLCELQTNETNLFRRGSGTGTNYSTLRRKGAELSNGGSSSGPVSFMKGFDTWAGITKSGGSTRRAACMRILNIDHPDIEEFIDTKLIAEKMARDLIKAGWPSDYNSIVYSSLPFQNANHSVRVTDDFMRAVKDDSTFNLIDRGNIYKSVRAKELFRKIAEVAHNCADPGLQFDNIINDWHTCKNSDRIKASNPCCIVGNTTILTSEGLIEIKDLYSRFISGQGDIPKVLSYDEENKHFSWNFINKIWVAGISKELIKITSDFNFSLECTPEHRIAIRDGVNIIWVEAKNIQLGDKLLGHNLDPYCEVKNIYKTTTKVEVYDMEVDKSRNFAVGSSGGFIIHNSEYMFLDDTACNLGSHNLVKYLTGKVFNTESFIKANEIGITAMEILVGMSSYPTEKIAKNSHDFRPLGIGWSNGGAMLMRLSYPYDSNESRHLLASITSLMTAAAYRQSAIISRDCGGPFKAFVENKESFLEVIEKHATANFRLSLSSAVHPSHYSYIQEIATDVWKEAEELGDKFGFRNAQASVLAPAGTISFEMDCDTTGIEPDIALVKYKKLAGGGSMKIVNKSVRPALINLKYIEEEIDLIEAHILKYETILGAPNFKKEHLPIFDCAVGIRSIKPSGHIMMMSSCQPFLSGAISKTVNLPSSASMEDIEDIYMKAWELGLKAVAIYRDNCKSSQPLNIKDNTEHVEDKCNFCDGMLVRTGACKTCVSCGITSSCG